MHAGRATGHEGQIAYWIDRDTRVLAGQVDLALDDRHLERTNINNRKPMNTRCHKGRELRRIV